MNTNTLIVKNKVIAALKAYTMIENTSHIIVGFSGGADSLCLLHILNSIKGEYGFSLSAAHVNHGIRGNEANRDAEFCSDFCEKIGVDFKLLEIDCVSLAKEHGESVEECGRNLRYDFFNQLCLDSTYKIATAHNANDNAETLLFNIARGTGIKGATGIPAVRDNIIRPLIYCTRDEIEAYCNENFLTYVTDSTNLCDDYTRNKIRHNILPVLTEINLSAIKNITSFTENAEDICDYMNQTADFYIRQAEKGDGYYDSDLLAGLHSAVLSQCIISIFRNVCDIPLDRQKVDSSIALLKNKGRIQIYGNIYAECIKNRFRFYRDNNFSVDDMLLIDISTVGEITFNGYNLTVERYINNSKKVNKNVLDNLIDCDKIVGNLWLRTRREGDKFTLHRRGVTKTIKKLFNELAIPVEQRDKLPVLCDEESVVWIYSIGTDSRCRINDNSSNIISIGGETND